MEILPIVAASLLSGISLILVVVAVSCFCFPQEEVSTLVGPVSGFVAFKAKVIFKTPLSFFWGKFYDVNGINIHGIWVSFLLDVVVIPVVLEGNE